ncbi:hypothetical protein [Succinivibrio sp.]|uniref:hypothetical protein n=1 Tax=Succinivibrio sp. TaxID=2053619 RepID=UPI003864FE4F
MTRFLKLLKNFWKYLINILIAFDQLVNTLFGGSCDETISALCYRKSQQKGHYFYKILKFILDICLSPIKQNHCEQAYLSEVYRKQLPPEYRR